MEREDRNFSCYGNAIIVLLVVNFGLAGLKLLFGYAIGSSALRSDGFNNTADFVYTLLLAVGLWISSRPADESHPEGHGRFESLVGLVVSVVIFATGVFVLWDAFQSFTHVPDIRMSQPAVILVTLSIGVKGVTGWFLTKEGNRLNSSPLNAIGRDQMGDMLADVAVIFAMLAVYYEVFWLDSLVAGGIGVSILLIGWGPFRRHLKDLTGRAPGTDLQQEIEDILGRLSLFEEVVLLRAHYVGPTLHVSLTTTAPADTSLGEVHEAEEALRQKILELEDVSRVFIHVEPPDANSPN